MEGGKLKEAIELIETKVQLFPRSWNPYDSLGGHTRTMVGYSSKSVLIPSNSPFRATRSLCKRISPDGRWIAHHSSQGGVISPFVKDLARGREERLLEPRKASRSTIGLRTISVC